MTKTQKQPRAGAADRVQKADTKVVTFRLREDLVAALKLRAEGQGIKPNRLVAQVLAEFAARAAKADRKAKPAEIGLFD